MNWRFAVAWVLVTAAIATVVGLITYHAGQTSQVVTTTSGDGSVSYPGNWGFGLGFVPVFGLFWIPLIGFLIFRFAFWRPAFFAGQPVRESNLNSVRLSGEYPGEPPSTLAQVPRSLLPP